MTTWGGKLYKTIVIGNKLWSGRIFREEIEPHSISHFFNELNPERINAINPRYIFFLHWSSLIPKDITDNYECIGFHMTDLPFGRGGSPLQNLIARGYHTTKLSAFRITSGLDTGAIYAKRELSLEGNAEEIYIRATRLSVEMIRDIIITEPHPVPQDGEVTVFKRRTPEQSEIPQCNLNGLYDHIRMLDAEGYPHAFIIHNGLRYEFTRASLYNGRILSDVVITEIEK